ncbi:hypothetical protein BX070DRAFT_25644 [Coemansia spiralis]|nr:hypothetical protein BX070DRAFT_25644 [Coemansia spiralis]
MLWCMLSGCTDLLSIACLFASINNTYQDLKVLQVKIARPRVKRTDAVVFLHAASFCPSTLHVCTDKTKPDSICKNGCNHKPQAPYPLLWFTRINP